MSCMRCSFEIFYLRLICYFFSFTLILYILLTLLLTSPGRVYKAIPSFCKKSSFYSYLYILLSLLALINPNISYFITFHNYFGPFWKLKCFHIIDNLRPSSHFVYLIFLRKIVSDLFGLTSLEYPQKEKMNLLRVSLKCLLLLGRPALQSGRVPGHSAGPQWSKTMFVSWKSTTLCIPSLFHRCPRSFCKFPHCFSLSGSVTWEIQPSARTHSAAERVFRWLADWCAKGFRLCHQKNRQVLACMGNNSEAMPLHDRQKSRTRPACRDVKIKSQVGL